ncbi:phosphatase PAP2 family protein [Brucella pituitosa]|uniref:phosphatase PAP2 family protein n=1 Tax=Brucella pituitosa TaxID=571256 RepID=UPI003F4AEE32
MNSDSILLESANNTYTDFNKRFLYFFIVFTGVFIIFPQIDLSVSRYFFRSGSFFISENFFWTSLRDMHRSSQWFFLIAVLVLPVLYAVWRCPLPSIAPHKILYVSLTFILGSGALVQGLKILIGRARPRHLIEFGGLSDFTPAWQLAGICRNNCSFPSGESSAAAVMLSLLVFVPARRRKVAALILVPLLVLISLNRVFMGAHFLSDVVIAWTLIVGLMLWLRPRVSRNADAIDNWVRLRGETARKRLYPIG